MNAIFTVVAKNYLAQARTLGDSLAQLHPELPFYIFLSDEADGVIDLGAEKYLTIEAKSLGIPKYEEMTFKYDVIEFSTAIKPFCFEHLFSGKGYDKILYLDPDIYVYRRLDPLFDLLDENFILMTPHHVTPEIDYSGMTSETLLLFVGIYNFGFAGLSNTESGRKVIDWWKSRLTDLGYADKTEGLHVDQKWMDFIPAFFDRGVGIVRHLGCNVAFWNLHERTLVETGAGQMVRHRMGGEPDAELIFFHFAAFDPYNDQLIHKHNPQFKRSLFPEFAPLLEEYAGRLLANGFGETVKLPYSYGAFASGDPVTKFQRRLFRRLLMEEVRFDAPFSTGSGSFHELLEANGLVCSDGSNVDRLNETNYDFRRKKRIIDGVSRGFLKLIGFNRYSLLSKFMLRYLRPENQIHLLSGVLPENELINENRRQCRERSA
jgi:hypothetical protein